jgi:preprotein translocase subunit YajC
MLVFLAQDSQGSSLIAFLPLILMGGVFYFLLIRPQQRRAKAQQALLRSVEVGDEVVTTSGIIGTITDIDDDDDIVTVEVGPGTNVRMLRGGIGRILSEDEPDDDGYDEDEDERGSSGDQPGPIQQL